EKTEQTGSTGRLPEVISIAVPDYHGGPLYKLAILIRYRVDRGAVHFELKRDRPDRIEQDAFDEILKQIEAETLLKPFMGA
ncbi:MAG: DUF2303 family protein, partial [Beijerinckiaceae bacterium]